MQIDTQYYPFVVVGITAVVIPAIIAVARRIGAAFDTARAVKLKEAIHAELKPIQEQQDRHHEQNRDFLETIRTEAYQRETRVVAAVEAVRTNMTTQLETIQTKFDTKLDTVHRRVDDLARMSGDRRHPNPPRK